MVSAKAPYSDEFYRAVGAAAEASAARILPLLFDLVAVTSIIDVGCGAGGWLAAARTLGVNDVLGLDGAWIDEARLKIPPENFRRTRLDQPLAIPRRFDLAISLEVAEHLPPERGAGLVAELTRLAPLVLFSAAVPAQGGTEHLNEQWPGYWARLFAASGYRAIDVLRCRLWDDPAVAFWYKQNLLLYADAAALDAKPALAAAAAASPPEPIALIHPDLYQSMVRRARPRIGRWLKMAPDVIRHSFARKRKGSEQRQ